MRRVLTLVAVAGLLVLAGCVPTAATAVGTWSTTDGRTILRLDDDATARFDRVPIEVLNLRGPQGTTATDVVGTWEFDDGKVVLEFVTADGDREVVLRFADSGDSDALSIVGDSDPYAAWLLRDADA